MKDNMTHMTQIGGKKVDKKKKKKEKERKKEKKEPKGKY